VTYGNFATGPQPVFSAPAVLADDETGQHVGVGSDGASYSWNTDSSQTGVIVPPSEDLERENRLPIFEAVESDWFRRGRQSVSRSPSPSGRSPEATPEDNGWTSPADEGWRAAEVVAAPASGGVTSAGLPKRVPRANLVPGAVGDTAAEQPVLAPARSAAATRERFASFQRGIREGRAAATGTGDMLGGRGDDGSS